MSDNKAAETGSSPAALPLTVVSSSDLAYSFLDDVHFRQEGL
jgi:hypothetical protein